MKMYCFECDKLRNCNSYGYCEECVDEMKERRFNEEMGEDVELKEEWKKLGFEIRKVVVLK
jgi:hypothetical protein